MKFKTIITEFAILIATFLATWLIVFWLTPAQDILNPSFTINQHESFFVLGWQLLVITPFLMLNTLIYFIKEAVHGFKRKFQNMILIPGNFILVAALCKVIAFIFFVSDSGGTLHPLLSALPKARAPFQTIAAIRLIGQGIFVVLIIFMLTLVISTFFTGKNWQYKNHEPSV